MPRTSPPSTPCNSASLSDVLRPHHSCLAQPGSLTAAWTGMHAPSTYKVPLLQCSAAQRSQSVVIDDCHPWEPNFTNDSVHLHCHPHNRSNSNHPPSLDNPPAARPQQPNTSLACFRCALPFPSTNAARPPQHSDNGHRHQPEGAFVTRLSWSPLPPRCLPKLTPTVASNAPGCLTLS